MRTRVFQGLLLAVSVVLILAPADGAWARKRDASDKTASAAKAPAQAAQPAVAVKLGFLTAIVPQGGPFFDPVPPDLGVQGARLAIGDNNTTGQFTGQRFDLTEIVLEAQADPLPAFDNLLKQGIEHVLVNLPADQFVALQRSVGSRPVLLFDVGARDDRLRAEDCAGNVLHTLPSHAMLADALGQYLLQKRWMKWFLVVGAAPGDALFAAAVERSAKRFGAKIVARKPWEHRFDDRRTPASEVPVFTQGVDYDVLVVADEEGAFGDELSYRTWLPRPVVGTQGLVAAGWHPVHEAWGAIQLQHRFREKAGRGMREVDYGAWLAVRAIGEAATRTRSVEFAAIRDYVLSDTFALAGFKGVPLSFRSWDRQLRQPVLLAQPRALVAVAPVEGIIHPKNELDTLGYDESESRCRLSR